MKKVILIILSCISCSAGPDSGLDSLIGSRIEGAWPAWSPDGKWLIFDGEEYQANWDPSDPNGRLIFIHKEDELHTLTVLDLDSYELTEWYSSNQQIMRPCFSRDGKKVAFLETGETGIRLIDGPGATPVTIHNLAGWGTSIRSIQTSRISDTILYVVVRKDHSNNIESIPFSGGMPDTLLHRKQEVNNGYWIFSASESNNEKMIAYYDAVGNGIYPGTHFEDFQIRIIIRDLNTQTEKALKASAILDYYDFYKQSPINCAFSWSPADDYLANIWVKTNIYYEAIYIDKL
jgi:Tol biopolymer transport system component